MTFRILVVDDEKNIRTGLAKSLKMDGYDVLQAENGKEGLNLIMTSEVDLVIADLRMPGIAGDELLRRVVSSYPTLPVIILTGHGTVDNAVQAMRDGAYDFLTKPVNLDKLSLLVQRALERRSILKRNQGLQEEIDRLEKRKSNFELLGKSTEMSRVLEVITQVASTRASVLVTGESGTGKELVAGELHRQSKRSNAPFVKVHCASLSESLLESELFGHEKGSFTGAINQRKGRFELAHTGTIFMDEIGEIDRSIQVKILRVLQEKSFERVGGEKTIEVDVRVIAATNRNLEEEVDAGRFREDLYYRLNVVNIHLPSLAERTGDILLLANSFLKEFVVENGKDAIGLDSKVAMALESHSWPGNIRELRNVIESAVVMSKGKYIVGDDLPHYLSRRGDSSKIRIPLGISMQEAEKMILRANLNALNGNKSKTAEVLGIGRKTLHNKLNDYGLENESVGGSENKQ